MPDLAEILSRDLLPCVQKPGQYVGLEHNARREPLQTGAVRVVLAFPDAYTVGISHLGSGVLYHALNDLPGVVADRTYCPLPDAEARMRERDIPLFAWESRHALTDFDAVGFSLGYELCVSNVLTMLDLAKIPLRADERTNDCPLILGGDALADSPEPLADFIDVFLPGDGEEPLRALVELLPQVKAAGPRPPREDLLLRIAREVPAAYVPRFYRPGPFGGVESVRDDVRPTVRRACLDHPGPSKAETHPLVPLFEGVHERVVVEVMRGCPNACRFCQAGHTRLPLRRRSPEDILTASRAGIDATGYDEVSLLSLSTGDYPDLEGLLRRLHEQFAGEHVNISLPSLRVDAQLRLLPALTGEVRKSGLTIAAEAGTDRLRRAIGKDITEDDVLEAVAAAWRAGYGSVKVYFLAGLPGETPADIDALFALCRKLSDTRRGHDGHRGAIHAAVSWFVPKPHTPMQWEPMRSMNYYFDVRARLIDLARKSPVRFRFHRIERSVLEGLIARGDRSLGRTILAAWRNGARLDGWDEHWNWDAWQAALDETGVDIEAVTAAEIPTGRRLPWDHVCCHLPVEALLRRRRAMHDLLDTEA
jgi:radical SAM family uncharacterized protein